MMEKKKLEWKLAILEQLINSFCGRYVRIVALYPVPFIIVPIILTAALSTGFIFKFEIYRNIDYLFSPTDARWKYEEQVFCELWAQRDDQFYPGI